VDSIEQFYHNEKDHLLAFIYRMTNSVPNAEDLAQETLLRALEKQDQFKGQSTFKTWIFSIAANLTIDQLRKEKRWSENVMDKAKSAAQRQPEFLQLLRGSVKESAHNKFEVKEHIDLCFTCLGKTLPLEQQITLMLKDVFDFRVKEISIILDKSTSQIKHYLEDARATMIEIFNRRCALINKDGVCHQCSELNGVFNSKQDAQQQLIEMKLALPDTNGDKKKLYDLRAALVKSVDPLQSSGHEFQQIHMQFICKIATEES
jgi:RNA polymerase sigma-70 factor (ECF subfamily)